MRTDVKKVQFPGNQGPRVKSSLYPSLSLLHKQTMQGKSASQKFSFGSTSSVCVWYESDHPHEMDLTEFGFEFSGIGGSLLARKPKAFLISVSLELA